MSGILTKDTELSVKSSGGTYTPIPLLMEVPEMGADPDRVEVTTLSDSTKRYIPGIKDLGDLQFSFLYDNTDAGSNFRLLKGYETANEVKSFRVEYPDGTTHDFDAYVNVKMDSASVNAALTFKATFYLQSEIIVTDPV